jgi:predicted RNase H-like nuclease (RuvC/YqgF family)
LNNNQNNINPKNISIINDNINLNNNQNDEINKLKSEVGYLENKIKEYENEKNNLNNRLTKKEKELNEFKLKISEYEYNNNILNNKLKNYENENNNLNNKNKELLDKIKILENKFKNSNNIDSNNDKEEIITLYKKIQSKDDEIKELKLKMPYILENNEKLMTIIFISLDQKIHYSFICKNTDKFNKIENLLYERYPEYLESENYFTFNGNKINKYKTIEENKINNSDIIVLNKFEEL